MSESKPALPERLSSVVKSCPCCNSKDLYIDTIGFLYAVVCNKCQMRGPRVTANLKDYPIEPIYSWNALPRKCEDSFILQHFVLPRRLRWTREKPTEEGWYWYRDKVTEPIMSLITTLDHKLVMNAYRRYQNAFIDRLDGEYDEEWAGPIPEPEDAE